MILAASQGCLPFVKECAENGCDIDVPGHNATRPLAHAVYAGRLDIVRCLLMYGVRVNALGRKGSSALMNNFPAFFGRRHRGAGGNRRCISSSLVIAGADPFEWWGEGADEKSVMDNPDLPWADRLLMDAGPSRM